MATLTVRRRMAKSKALMVGLPFYLAFEGEGNMGQFPI